MKHNRQQYQPIPQHDDNNSNSTQPPQMEVVKMTYNPQIQPPPPQQQHHLLAMPEDPDLNNFDETTDGRGQTTCCQDLDRAATLTRCERIVGFLLLFIIGWGLSLTTLSSYKTIFSYPRQFCLFYTIGNILSLLSNFFLYGPSKQCKSMFRSPFRIPSILYVTTICITLYCAITNIDIRITIAAVICQFVASIIFTVVYIINGVFGRAICWFVKYAQQDDREYDLI